MAILLSTHYLHTNAHKQPHNEHLKAGSVLVILGATGEFIKRLPKAIQVWVCVQVCVVLWVEQKSMQRFKQLNHALLT